MKKLFSLITIVLSLTVLAACGSSTASSGAQSASPSAPANRLEKILAEGKLTISTSPDFAPYEFIDLTKKGQESIVGSDIELAKYIAGELGVELVIESMDFSAALAAVQEGKVDLCISGLAYTEERAKIMLLSDGYNKGGYQGIMVLKSELGNLKTTEDFSGKKIGAQNASLQYDNVINQIPEATVEPVTSVADGIMMLRSGKIDALAMSGASGDQYSKNYDDIAMSEFRFVEEDDSGNVLGIMNGETELHERVNEIIAKANEQALYSLWLDQASELSSKLAGN